MTEAEALVDQARSDFATFHVLLDFSRSDVPSCHPLHYLQMACEKLAKALMLKKGAEGFDRFSHVAFTHLLYLVTSARFARSLGQDYSALKRFTRYAAPLFRQVDELHPSVVPPAANVEYPWESRDAQGRTTWNAPRRHDFQLLRALEASAAGIELLAFIEAILERFDAVRF